ncbi:MAG TPA: alpha/beta fold hydrolase [Chryseosolibacter sp.]
MSKKLVATLIGINAYKSKPLYGCVKDVLAMDMLLREITSDSGLSYRPFYLMAPHDTDKESIAEHVELTGSAIDYELPTLDNVANKAFLHFKGASSEDICLFFYAGHGAQVESLPLFQFQKSDRLNETLVCLDSRDPGSKARDLIDKEVAYLLWDALRDNNSHCVVVMDCCHSGNNSRLIGDSSHIRTRQETFSPHKIPLEEYIGFKSGNDFYTKKEGWVEIKYPRIVQLSACQDFELAQESYQGGIFTNRLINCLRSAGFSQTYNQIADNILNSVQYKTDKQNPVRYAKIPADLDRLFLGGEIKKQTGYEVTYDAVRKAWKLNCGALHGVGPSTGTDISYCIVDAFNIPIVEVFSTYSFLQDDLRLKKGLSYKGRPLKLKRAINVSLAENSQKDGILFKELGKAFDSLRPTSVEFSAESIDPDFSIHFTDKGEYLLTKAGGTTPVFRRQSNPERFVQQLEAIGKWINCLQLTSTASIFKRDDFIFKAEKLEGVHLTPDNIDHLNGEQVELSSNEVVLRWIDNHDPGFRLQISFSDASAHQQCFVAVLYLESRFGIKTTYVPADAGRLIRGGAPIALEFGDGDTKLKTIPLSFDDQYIRNGVTEVSSYLKIVISDKPLNLAAFEQDNLELDPLATFTARDVNNNFVRSGQKPQLQNWAVFTVRLILQRPQSVSEKNGLNEILLPENLNAEIEWLTNEALARSDEDGIKRSNPFGDAVNECFEFQNDMTTLSVNPITALKISTRDSQSFAQVRNEAVRIAMGKTKLVKTTANDQYDELILPYSYSSQTGLFLPHGYSVNGEVVISQLPNDSHADTRGIESTVTLYFRKLFTRKVSKPLALHVYHDGIWQSTSDVKEIQSTLTKHNGKVLLIVHGLFSSSEYIFRSLDADPLLREQYPFVLAFDYESLSTSFKQAAEDLNAQLLGLGGVLGQRQLNVIAHSTGGLIARWLVEKLNTSFVDDVVMLGTPNAGASVAALADRVHAFLVSALNLAGPIKYAITGLGFLLRKLQLNPAGTIQEITPGSALLLELNTPVAVTGVTYRIFGASYNAEANPDDAGMALQVGNYLRKNMIASGVSRVVFGDKENDLVCTIESMSSTNGFNGRHFRIFNGHHLSYLSDTAIVRDALAYTVQQSK